MPTVAQPDEDRPQPTWTVYFHEDEDDERSPSQFVEVTVTHRLEVVDDAALRDAVAASAGPPQDDLDERLRAIPRTLLVSRCRGRCHCPTWQALSAGEAP